MSGFKAPVDDILFSLRHVARADRLPDWDDDLAAGIIGHFATFAEAEIATVDEIGDRDGCRLENGRIRMPEALRTSYRRYVEQGWPGLGIPEAHGGQGVGAPILGAVSEIFSGACHALQMVVALAPGAARTILAHGTDAQAAALVPPLAEGRWLSTMCLTEPGAGSDLSGLRTRAVEDGGVWRLTGEKIFISGGDQDLSDGVLHLVLARTGDPTDGTRGLGLFACRSETADGRRNAVTVARHEEKMGLHASPTCHLVFDGAEAEILGRPGDGLKVMFTMMNHARLDVALQGVAHAANAARRSRAYAEERRQGRALGLAGPAPIAAHPDVARMLDRQDMLAVGARALAHVSLVALEEGRDPDLVDALTPVCKVAGTEAGIEAADLGIQVLGGYGYLREYRLEQIYRDARITSIYEGTNGIHALTLATRLLSHDGGRAVEALERFLSDAADLCPASYAEALDRWRDARRALAAAPQPAAGAHAFMQMTVTVARGAVFARIDRAADHAADPDRMRRLARRCLAALPQEAAALAATLALDLDGGAA